MKIRCTSCHNQLEVPDEAHYQEMACPLCGAKFQVVTEATQQISRDFLASVLKDLEKKPE